jgi:hypothetical protein
MATKKTKFTPKDKTVETKAAKVETKKPSQSAMILDLLKRKVEPAKIVEKVRAVCGGKPTIGYVNHLGRKNNLLAVAS